jgi:hypothetical protein
MFTVARSMVRREDATGRSKYSDRYAEEERKDNDPCDRLGRELCGKTGGVESV